VAGVSARVPLAAGQREAVVSLSVPGPVLWWPRGYGAQHRYELAADAPLVLHHQKAEDGNAKLLRGLGDHLPRPVTYDDWHYLTQLNRARAVAFGIERFRSLAPHCMGTIVWQLNDCWPVTSWAAVDGDGRRKPLWYALRHVYADRLLTVQGDSVAVVNDGDEPWLGELVLTGEASAAGRWPRRPSRSRRSPGRWSGWRCRPPSATPTTRPPNC